MSTYLNEGATEYLNHLSEKNRQVYCYRENVNVIRFLREFIGDSIIQSYLEGNKRYFFNDLDEIISEDIKIESEREDEIDKFFEYLDERHEYLYEDEYKYEEVQPIAEKINDFFIKKCFM